MLDGFVLELQGDAAVQVHERMKNPWLPFLTIEQDNHQTVIPIQNILYIDFTRLDQIQQIKQQMEKRWEQIYQAVPLDEILLPEEREWAAEEEKTFVLKDDGEWEMVSQDPQVAQWLFEIEWLEEQLEATMKQQMRGDIHATTNREETT